MKHFFTLMSLFLSISLFGQADFTKYQQLANEFAEYGATPKIFTLDQSRAGVELTHNLDSIVSKFGSFVYGKLDMQYNDNGTTNRIDEYGLDSTGADFRLRSIYTFTYGGIELPNNLLVEEWNDDSQQFEESIGITLSYDGMERVDSVVVSLEDPFTGVVGPLIALKYIYNGDHLVQSNQWLNVSFLGGWIPGSISYFDYDQDNLVLQETFVLDFLTMSIIPSSRTFYSYNGAGLTDTINTFLYDDPNWLPEQRTAIDYYGNDAIANEFNFLHDGSDFVNNTWTNYPIEDVNDEYITNIHQWDAMQGLWALVDSTYNLLNPSLTWDEVAAPTELGVLAVLGGVNPNVPFLSMGSVTDQIHYNVSDTIISPVTPAGMDFYYYSLRDGSAVSPVLPEYISVTPNPAQEQFTITIDQNTKADYVIFAANGVEKTRGVAQQGTNYVQTASWPQGMYYIIMTTADGTTFAHKQLVQ